MPSCQPSALGGQPVLRDDLCRRRLEYYSSIGPHSSGNRNRPGQPDEPRETPIQPGQAEEVETQPQPQPAEPQPAEPQPAEPQPAEPQPAEPQPAEPHNLKTIHVKRTNVEGDVMKAFADINMEDVISFRMVNPMGKVERGVGIGVVREVYTLFWNEVLVSRFSGAVGKVPVLTNTMFREEWATVGKILLKGWKDTGYFPGTIVQAIMVQVFDDDSMVDDSLIITSFLATLSHDENELINKLRSGEEHEEDDEDTLEEFCELYQVKCVLSSTNIDEVLLQIARKEIIQKPFFVIDCWRNLIRRHWAVGSLNVALLYETLQPTTARVIKLLRCSPTSDLLTKTEKSIFSYLKKFIRELGAGQLKKFLQWATGSDLMLDTIKEIKVMFREHTVQGSGLARAPVAHSCGPCLELPNSYVSSNDLSRELHGILVSRPAWWDFDII